MRAEYTAFKSRLEGHPLLSGKVSTAVRFANGNPVRTNYVVAYPSAPDRLDDERYTAAPSASSERTLTYDVRVVAVDADGVLLLAEAVVAQVVGHRLSVSGRVCDPMWLVPGVEEGRVEYDKTTDLYYLDMSFRYVSRRA